VKANGRSGPVRSIWSEFHYAHCPVVSDSSSDVGLVCGMKRGICAKFWAFKPSFYNVTSHNYDLVMSQTQSTPSKKSTALDALDESERDWLAERLVEYRELLEFLHSR